jgi:RNA polymerase sigma-70 factor (ECF subfamily)
VKAKTSTDAVWVRLSADLRQFIRRRVPDDHAADDLLQETFLRIHRNLGTIHDSDRLAGWVYQIARNVVRDHYRKAPNSTVPLADAEPADDADDRQSPPRFCGAEWLDGMIGMLPDGYREAVQLAEIEGQTQQEVADKFGITLSGAKSKVQRGRAMLRDALNECCTFHFDQAGRVMDCDPRPSQKICKGCGNS